jgi:hypothetical protein
VQRRCRDGAGRHDAVRAETWAFITIGESHREDVEEPCPIDLVAVEQLEDMYRRLVAVMLNFVPAQGNPG